MYYHTGESNSNDIVDDFMMDWIRLKDKYPDIIMVTDCPVPVEANLISEGMKLYFLSSDWIKYSPYPILDLTTLRIGMGLRKFYLGRKDNELPEHNPLNDARQTYRGLITCIELS